MIVENVNIINLEKGIKKMYQIILLNEKGIRFEKTFESEYLFRKFVNKAKHSKKLTLLFYGKEY